jgi:hypothetical protein
MPPQKTGDVFYQAVGRPGIHFLQQPLDADEFIEPAGVAPETAAWAGPVGLEGGVLAFWAWHGMIIAQESRLDKRLPLSNSRNCYQTKIENCA